MDLERGERAVTHYKVLETRRHVTLAELHLETGRTHQIRVHMQYLGAPLLGDYLYHPDFTCISRVALHSSALAFTHPITREPMQFRVPLPRTWQKHFIKPDMAASEKPFLTCNFLFHSLPEVL